VLAFDEPPFLANCAWTPLVPEPPDAVKVLEFNGPPLPPRAITDIVPPILIKELVPPPRPPVELVTPRVATVIEKVIPGVTVNTDEPNAPPPPPQATPAAEPVVLVPPAPPPPTHSAFIDVTPDGIVNTYEPGVEYVAIIVAIIS
jgi:hypothetical protein